MTEEEMKEALIIDEFALDTEFKENSGRFMNACDTAAEQELYTNKLKDRLEVLKARLRLEVRDDPYRFGLKKLTETAINDVVTVQPDVMKLTNELTDNLYTQRRYDNFVKSMNKKGRDLENITSLMSMQYFSEPKDKAKKNIKEEKVMRSKRTVKKIKEAMNN